jgi:hypothetical protein
MKYTLLYLLLITVSFSQVEKGFFFINPNASFSLRNTKTKSSFPIESDQTSFSLRNQLGYFVRYNFAVGASLNYSYSSTESEQKGSGLGFPSNAFKSSSSQSSIQIGPFIRYYQEVSEDVQVYLHLEYLYTNKFFETSSAVMDESEETTDTQIFYGGLGLAFFLTEQSSIDLSLLYLYSNQDVSSNVSATRSGLVTAIGYSFYFTLD